MRTSPSRARATGLGRVPLAVWVVVAAVSVVGMMASIGERSTPLLSTPAIFAVTLLVAAFGYTRGIAARSPRAGRTGVDAAPVDGAEPEAPGDADDAGADRTSDR